MAKNIPTFLLNPAAVTARNAEYAGTPLTDTVGAGTYASPYLGCNRAGSCAIGVGINTAEVDPKLQDWSVKDQFGATGTARVPQQSQHIGGNGLGAGADNTTKFDINALLGTDINDQMAYLAATQQAVADAIFDVASGAVNKTGKTVEIDDVLWGIVPVA